MSRVLVNSATCRSIVVISSISASRTTNRSSSSFRIGSTCCKTLCRSSCKPATWLCRLSISARTVPCPACNSAKTSVAAAFSLRACSISFLIAMSSSWNSRYLDRSACSSARPRSISSATRSCSARRVVSSSSAAATCRLTPATSCRARSISSTVLASARCAFSCSILFRINAANAPRSSSSVFDKTVRLNSGSRRSHGGAKPSSERC